jgi:hypothetical protein
MEKMSLSQKIWEIKNDLKKIKKTTPGFKFKYVNLIDIEKNIKPELIKHNLGYLHKLKVIDSKNVLSTTVFSFDSDEVDVHELVIPDNVVLTGMNGYQSLGSALTYFRRYSLVTIFGILTDEDVDAVKQETKAIVEVDHLAKVNQLISIGRPKATLEKYYTTYKDSIDAKTQELIVKLIQEAK